VEEEPASLKGLCFGRALRDDSSPSGGGGRCGRRVPSGGIGEHDRQSLRHGGWGTNFQAGLPSRHWKFGHVENDKCGKSVHMNPKTQVDKRLLS
jgi:hypothetical protein